MAEFTYEALSKLGQRSNGALTASSEREAASMLDARGLFPVRINAMKAKGRQRFGKKVKGRVVAIFYGQLADLIHSGVPLLKALDLLENLSTNPVLSEVLREVRAKVADGTNLADAMKPFPQVFNELSVGMVRAGLEGGFLEDVLKRIAVFTEHQEDMKGKVVGALAYPVFLGVVGVIVLNVLVIFFVPKFESIFKKLEEKDELPALTSALMGLSHFMQNFWWLIFGGLAALFFAYRSWVRTSGRPAAHGPLPPAGAGIRQALSLVVVVAFHPHSGDDAAQWNSDSPGAANCQRFNRQQSALSGDRRIG